MGPSRVFASGNFYRMADEIPVEASAVLATAPVHTDHAPTRHLRLQVLSGSFLMLLSSVFVGCMNLVYNFAIAHRLGAENYGHVSVVYTLLMLLSCITLSFQLLCSKFVARAGSSAEKTAIYHLLHRWAWVIGPGVGGLLTVAAGGISEYLNLPAKLLILQLALATVFYVPLGVRRGFMQGTYDFKPLAMNFMLEVVVKLVGALALVSSYGIEGVIAAMTASVAVAYLVAIPRKHFVSDASVARLSSGIGEGVQAATFFIGQVIINNLDIILVKHFFDATQAGVYASIALIGRLVYVLSWQIVSGMFPFSAGIRSGEKGGETVLTTALGLVASVGAAFTLSAWLAPPRIWHLLLGAGFPIGQHGFYSSLLLLYALTSAIYALAVVLMTYEISRKISYASWVQLGFSGSIFAGIYLFHGNLQQVILVQLVLMLFLLLFVSIPFVTSWGGRRKASPASALQKLRRVSEDEVIGEFLRNEFYAREYSPYWESFAELVKHPDYSDERENILRRALLFHRRGRLWRELPVDTEWWEVELSPQDLTRVRVFARSQWLRYGAPRFRLLDTVERIRTSIHSQSRSQFIEKLRSLSLEMAENSHHSSVLLIGTDESSQLTIIEGNHRMTAAALVSQETLPQRFRILCGFSPLMSKCCWYRTDAFTLWRYALNTLAFYLIDRHKLRSVILESENAAASRGINAA